MMEFYSCHKTDKKNVKEFIWFWAGDAVSTLGTVCMDFEQCFKFYNLVSVHPKSMKLGQMTNLKAGVNLKAVFWLVIMALTQISRLRFKQSRISMLITHIYVLGCFVNFLVIFRYIWR